jgi:hypothetical protein
VWWRPHLHRHQWIVPEYIRTLDSTGTQSRHIPRITSRSAIANQRCLQATTNRLLLLKSHCYKQNQNMELITSFVASKTPWRVAGSGNIFTSDGVLGLETAHGSDRVIYNPFTYLLKEYNLKFCTDLWIQNICLKIKFTLDLRTSARRANTTALWIARTPTAWVLQKIKKLFIKNGVFWMWRRADIAKTDVSEECIASIFRV